MALEKDIVQKNVVFVHGRPSSHPTHAAYAKSVSAEFQYVDFKLRYHDIQAAGALRKYLSWVICALNFPKRNRYNVFLSEEAYFMLGLMRMMGLISRRKKLIAMMGSHTLYFLHTNQYSPRTKKAFEKLFNLYDGFICEGPIQVEILKTFIHHPSKVVIKEIINGSPIERFSKLILINPNLNGLNIITIGAIPNKDRMFYKGIDLMLKAFAIAKKVFVNLTYTIVGAYDKQLMENLIEECCPNYKSDIIFTGQTSDMGQYLKSADLYLHTARGEAWGISVTEAMAAGVVPIVSDLTGSKVAVQKISSDLIVPLEIDLIANKIIWYFSLSYEAKKEFSDYAKKVSMDYTEDKAILCFQKAFSEIVNDVN